MPDSDDLSTMLSGITSPSDALTKAVTWLDTSNNCGNAGNNGDSSNSISISNSIQLLRHLQSRISKEGLFSKNESLDDVATSSVELLSVDYHLGRAFLMLPASYSSMIINNDDNTENPSIARKKNVLLAVEYFHSFLKQLEQLGEDLLLPDTLKEYHLQLDLQDNHNNDNNHNDSTARVATSLSAAQTRELKIQRYQRKKSTCQKLSHLQSTLHRRHRLNMAPEEEMDGHDHESLTRTCHIEQLRMYADECLEEMQSSRGELDMLEMAIAMQGMQHQERMDPRMNMTANNYHNNNNNNSSSSSSNFKQQTTAPSMKLTQITQNPMTGELQIQQITSPNQQQNHPSQQQSQSEAPILFPHRQQISNTVFRPHWNQPTMTLDELAHRERADAIQRSEAQSIAESKAMFQPRRYDQLVKDGMEDDEGLVEASAVLDRKWDDWKEENPRGSGNKMGERGDRNF